MGTFSAFDNLSKSDLIKLFLFILLIISEINFLLVAFSKFNNISFLTVSFSISLWISSVLITSTIKYLSLFSIKEIDSTSLTSKILLAKFFERLLIVFKFISLPDSFKVIDLSFF